MFVGADARCADDEVAPMTVPLAYGAETVRKLTGLSDRRLRSWDQTGFFSPTYADGPRRVAGRVYAFADLVGLRTIALLRRRGVSLQELRKVGAHLKERRERPWSELRFWTDGKLVYVGDPDAGTLAAAGSRRGQTVMRVLVEEVARETAAAAERLRERAPEEIGEVVRRRGVLHNAPTLVGTRIPTVAVWDFHRAGYDTDAIIGEYPRLTPLDVERAIAFERERHREAERRAS